MALVRPIQAFISNALDGSVVLGPADILDDDDVHVRTHPTMFIPLAVTVRGAVTAVEQASAAPGEKRSTRR